MYATFTYFFELQGVTAITTVKYINILT